VVCSQFLFVAIVTHMWGGTACLNDKKEEAVNLWLLYPA